MLVALGDRFLAQLHRPIHLPEEERGEPEAGGGHDEPQGIVVPPHPCERLAVQPEGARDVVAHHGAHAEKDRCDGGVPGVTEAFGQVATRLEPGLAAVDVALVERMPPVHPQQQCPLRGRLVHELEDAVHPVAALAEEATDHGLGGDGADHVHRARNGLVGLLEAEGEGRAVVVALEAHPRQELTLTRSEPRQVRTVDVGEVVAVPAPQLVLLPGRCELLPAECPDRLRHPVAHRVGPRLGQQDGLVHQPTEEVQHQLPGYVVAGTHLLDRLEVEASWKDAEPGPQRPLLGRAQVVAPLDQRVHAAVPCGSDRIAGPQEVGVFLEPLEDLLRREDP